MMDEKISSQPRPARTKSRFSEAIFTDLPIGLCHFDDDLHYTFINNWLAEINGVSAENHIGRSITEILPHIAEHVIPPLRKVIETGEPIIAGEVSAETPAQPGVMRSFKHSYVPVYSDDGSVSGLSCVVEEVTDLKHAERKLKKAGEILEQRIIERTQELHVAMNRYKEIVEIAPAAIITMSDDMMITLFNSKAEKMFGYIADEVLGTSLLNLIAQCNQFDFEKIIADFQNSSVTSSQLSDRGEILGRRSDDTAFPTEAYISQLDISGEAVFTIIISDITKSVEAENSINAALQEKEILVREVHHRVKNNLQVVSSMLSLQAEAENHCQTTHALNESIRRVEDMARAHEFLYQSGNLSTISARDYLNTIVKNAVKGGNLSGSDIKYSLNIDECTLDIQQLIPCGQIISELISNSMKHAFASGHTGNIEVSLQRQGGTIAITVADDGMGTADCMDYQYSTTLGNKLVYALVTQLRGVIENNNAGGTSIKFTFPEKPHA